MPYSENISNARVDPVEYTGFKEVNLSDSDVTNLYSGELTNQFGCVTNEYIIPFDKGGVELPAHRWDGTRFVKVAYKTVSSRYCDKIKPRNVHQQLAIDMLYNNDITVKMLAGRFGSGKDLLMSAVAADMLDKEKVEKIVYVRNNIEVKDSKPIGYLPGSSDEKLAPYAMVLAEKFGGKDGLDMMISRGMIEIAHLGFMRGRDIKNAIVYCSEAENMTREHIQLLLGRIGEGSSLWINGDCRQTDLSVFKENSGMKRAIEKLKGNPMFGYVKLVKTERSLTAQLADLLD